MRNIYKFNIFIYVLLLVSLSSIFAKPLIAKKIVHAINAGSHMPKKSIEGFNYARDTGYDEDTNAVDYSSDANLQNQIIKYAKEPSIYMTERHGYHSFSYNLSLEKEGVYTIILKFCEMYFDKPGRRVFHIKLGDQRVIQNLDVFAKSGKFVAHDEYIEIKYSNGQVYFKNQVCKNAIVDRKINITFEKTQQDNPIIQGIILYAGGLDQTDFDDLQSFKQTWDKNFNIELKKRSDQQNKLKESKLKKQEKIIVRNDHQEIEEEDFEDVIQFHKIKVEADVKEGSEIKQEQGRRSSIKELVMTPIGIIITLGSFFAVFGVITSIFFEKAKILSQSINYQNQSLQREIENIHSNNKLDSKFLSQIQKGFIIQNIFANK